MFLQLLRPKQTRHHVVVHDNTPPPGRPTLSFAPFFLASCGCGWFGPARQTSEEAFADARAHTDDVDENAHRALG